MDATRALQDVEDLDESIVQPSIPGHLPAHQIRILNSKSDVSDPLVVLVN